MSRRQLPLTILMLVLGCGGDDRIALAGPGALLSIFEDGVGTTHQSPAIEGEVPDDVALHVVAFSPDGERIGSARARGRASRSAMPTERPRFGSGRARGATRRSRWPTAPRCT